MCASINDFFNWILINNCGIDDSQEGMKSISHPYYFPIEPQELPSCQQSKKLDYKHTGSIMMWI